MHAIRNLENSEGQLQSFHTVQSEIIARTSFWMFSKQVSLRILNIPAARNNFVSFTFSQLITLLKKMCRFVKTRAHHVNGGQKRVTFLNTVEWKTDMNLWIQKHSKCTRWSNKIVTPSAFFKNIISEFWKVWGINELFNWSS